jgi:hypothetical protein
MAHFAFVRGWAKRYGGSGNQSGQALVLIAISAVALVAVCGLALDSGRAYVDRRALQGGADTASEAATIMLAANFHQPPVPFIDSQVAAQVAAQVNNSTSAGSGLSAYSTSASTSCNTTSTTPPTTLTATCAWYTDTTGSLLLWPSGTSGAGSAVQVGNGVLPPVCPPASPPDPVWGSSCSAGVSVVPYYTHSTIFLGALGISAAAERAVATSTFAPILTAQGSGIAHYAVWAGCSVDDPTAVDVGDQVIIRSTDWKDSAGCGQTGLNPNDFKGWFHNSNTSTPSTSNGCCPVPQSLSCSGTGKTSYTELDYFCMSGGNSIGLESADIALIHASWQSCQPGSTTGPCQPVLLPSFDMMNGGGSNIQAHLLSWVAAVPDQDWNSPLQGDWTVHVVALVPRRGDWTSGCGTPPCPNPPPATPVVVSLLQ